MVLHFWPLLGGKNGNIMRIQSPICPTSKISLNNGGKTPKLCIKALNSRFFHSMCVIACMHASTCTTSLMHAENNIPLLFMTVIVWDIGMKEMKERSKISNLMVDHFSLTFVNLSLAWMLYFHAWLQNKGKILSVVWLF